MHASFHFLHGLLAYIIGVWIYMMLQDIVLGFFFVTIVAIFLVNVCLYLPEYRRSCVAVIVFLSLSILWTGKYMEDVSRVSRQLEQLDAHTKYTLVLEIEEVYKKQQFEIDYLARVLEIDETTLKESVRSIIRVPKNILLTQGQQIQLETYIFFPKDTEDFAYKQYLLSKGIYLQLSTSSLETIGSSETPWYERKIGALRAWMLAKIQELYPENEAIFLGGILIGAREELSETIKNNFNRSGLTHFIAVSGFNITIIVVFLGYLVSYFPVLLRVIIMMLAIGGFTVLVGDTAPVVRASIMGLVAYYILMSGRSTRGIMILAFTLVLMLIYSPMSIRYDVSLHLSFLAVLGIMYFQEFFSRVFSWVPGALAIRESLVLTFSAMILTLPIMIFNFGQVSIVSPISNVLVAWTIPLAMLLGALSIIGSLISTILGMGIGFFAWIPLKYDMLLVELFGNLPFSTVGVDFGIYGWYIEMLYFMLMVFVMLYIKQRSHG